MSLVPPASKDIFRYSSGVFFASTSNKNQHRRYTFAELTEHFSSGNDQPGHWYEAQLLHYGLPPSKTKGTAKMRLFDAVSKGILEVPKNIVKIETELKREWNKREKEAKKEIKAKATAAATAAASKRGTKRKAEETTSVIVNVAPGTTSVMVQVSSGTTTPAAKKSKTVATNKPATKTAGGTSKAPAGRKSAVPKKAAIPKAAVPKKAAIPKAAVPKKTAPPTKSATKSRTSATGTATGITKKQTARAGSRGGRSATTSTRTATTSQHPIPQPARTKQTARRARPGFPRNNSRNTNHPPPQSLDTALQLQIKEEESDDAKPALKQENYSDYDEDDDDAVYGTHRRDVDSVDSVHYDQDFSDGGREEGYYDEYDDMKPVTSRENYDDSGEEDSDNIVYSTYSGGFGSVDSDHYSRDILDGGRKQGYYDEDDEMYV